MTVLQVQTNALCARYFLYCGTGCRIPSFGAFDAIGSSLWVYRIQEWCEPELAPCSQKIC